MSNPYSTRPHSEGGFPVNEELAGLVPMISPPEQLALELSLINTGQAMPIAIWRGEIVDGRCRQKCLLKLKMPINYVELNSNDSEKVIEGYVKAVNTRRNLEKSQKVMIAGLESVKKTASAKELAKQWAVSLCSINNAKYLWRRYPVVARTLFDGLPVEIVDHKGFTIATRHITPVYRYYKKLDESSVFIDEDFMATDLGSELDMTKLTETGRRWIEQASKNQRYINAILYEKALGRYPSKLVEQ